MTRHAPVRTTLALALLAAGTLGLAGCTDDAKGDEVVDKLIKELDRIDAAVAGIETKEDIDGAIATIDDVTKNIRDLGKEAKGVRVTKPKLDELKKKMETWGQDFQKAIEAQGERLASNPDITRADIDRLASKMSEVEAALKSWAD